jgi:hypothetical protein
MTSTKQLLAVAFFSAAVLFTTSLLRAQETPPQPTPATPMPAASPTLMDRAYDGRLHVTLAPYIWLPTARTNLQFTIPKLPTGAGGTFVTNTTVGPSDYLSKINSAAMFSFGLRQGDVEVIGDYIYTNFSSSATFNSTLSGPVGKLKIPLTVTSNARLASSIWELAAGLSIAHSHSADANFFVGWRQFPSTTTLSYTATVGKRGLLSRAGTVKVSPLTNDVIFGFNGRIFAGDHWYVPYYGDIGVGATQQSWQAYGGVGYAFNHGQSFIATYRTLNYYGFAGDAPIRKLSLYGPLLGYTFGL